MATVKKPFIAKANGDIEATGVLKSTQSQANEGGEIQLSLPSSGSTLSSNVIIDVYQNKLRFFDSGGTNKGAYIDLSAATGGVGSDLLAGGGGGDLNGLSDVTITSITDNEILQYDSGTSSWINQTISEAGLVSGVGTNKISYQTTAPSSPATGDIWIDSDATSTGTNLDALSDVNITSNTIGEVLAWDGTNWINETPEEIGTHLGFRTGFYYATAASNTQANASNTQAVFTPFFVPKRTTFDRIACRTGTGFSGSGVVRLGIYTNLDGQPDSLILDSGQLSCTAAGQVFEATINTTLDPGVYWLCFVSQTAATTNQYRCSTTGYFFGGPQYGNTSAGGGQNVGWVITSGFTGALPATAGTPTVSGTCQTVWLRKA